MPEPIRTLAFCGSLRKASYNRMLLEAAVELAPRDMNLEEAKIGGLPLYNADLHPSGFPPAVQQLIDQVAGPMHPVNKPEVLVAQAQNKFDAAGRLVDETARGLIRDLLAELAAWTRRLAR